MYDIPGENDLVSAKTLEKGESFQQWTKILEKIFVIQFAMNQLSKNWKKTS